MWGLALFRWPMSAINVEWGACSGELSLQTSSEHKGQISYLVTLSHQVTPPESHLTPLGLPPFGGGFLVVGSAETQHPSAPPCQRHARAWNCCEQKICKRAPFISRGTFHVSRNMKCQQKKSAATLCKQERRRGGRTRGEGAAQHVVEAYPI